MRSPRTALACGIVGPAAFVGAWLVGGLLRAPDYSPVSQAISQLARSGTSTGPLMTAGFVAFGVLMPVYGAALYRRVGRACGAATTLSGLATLAVAALPLSAAGGQPVDGWHAVAAGTGYAAQVLAPLAGGLRFAGARARAVSCAVSGLALVCLVGSVALPDLTGLLQRAGLTVVDLWYVGVAVHLLRVSWRGPV
ncbi:MAG TPA: DUF998 domain-containing protein [Mycobacteriales bacterium]|nr:DUF998 domain-containing protein [Mycobacteriales bacterium]